LIMEDFYCRQKVGKFIFQFEISHHKINASRRRLFRIDSGCFFSNME
jgi:hypothetical protein